MFDHVASSHIDDVVRFFGEKGDEFLRVYERFGSSVYEPLRALGSDVIVDLERYGDRFLDLFAAHSDDLPGLYREYGSRAVEAGIAYGDNLFRGIATYGDDYARLVMNYGDDVVDGIARHGDDFMERYAKSGDEFVEEFLEKGDEVFEGGTQGGGSISYVERIKRILQVQGLTLEQFDSLRLRDVSTLTDEEKQLLKIVRESVPMPNKDTLLQKVIPASDIEKYMNGTYTQVGGYIARAEDVAHLHTYKEIYESLRLDYPGSVYNPVSDKSLGVIRYTTDEVSKISIPYSVEFGGNIIAEQPFTGNGFTKAVNGQIIPEFKCEGYLEICDGAQLIEIYQDGTEVVLAIYSEIKGRFVSIE